VIGPWLSLVGFVVGVVIWVFGIVRHVRQARFLGQGFTIGNAACFALLCLGYASIR